MRLYVTIIIMINYFTLFYTLLLLFKKLQISSLTLYVHNILNGDEKKINKKLNYLQICYYILFNN
jgi:hypothetical protein